VPGLRPFTSVIIIIIIIIIITNTVPSFHYITFRLLRTQNRQMYKTFFSTEISTN